MLVTRNAKKNEFHIKLNDTDFVGLRDVLSQYMDISFEEDSDYHCDKVADKLFTKIELVCGKEDWYKKTNKEIVKMEKS